MTPLNPLLLTPPTQALHVQAVPFRSSVLLISAELPQASILLAATRLVWN